MRAFLVVSLLCCLGAASVALPQVGSVPTTTTLNPEVLDKTTQQCKERVSEQFVDCIQKGTTDFIILRKRMNKL